MLKIGLKIQVDMSQILVDSDLQSLLDSKLLVINNLDAKNIQPSSIDIPITGKKIHKMPYSSSFWNQNIDDVIKKHGQTIQLKDSGTHLAKGQTYIVEVGKVNLPQHIALEASPKSSAGRINLGARLIADKSGKFDHVNPNTQAKLYLEITPKNFSVIMRPGDAINQIIARDYRIKSEVDIEQFPLFKNANDPKLIAGNGKPFREKNQYFVHINIPEGLAAYKAKNIDFTIDLSKKNHYNPNDFFWEIHGVDGKLLLEKDGFYLMCTQEILNVPPELSVIMNVFSEFVGDIRTQSAGYFDPGFYGSGVFEFSVWENMMIRHRQPICVMSAYANSSIPQATYGAKDNSYLGQQKIRLAKYFVQP